MSNIILIIAACTLPADHHWAVGGWQTSTWGGVMIRPDKYVIERDPDGNIEDIGVWYELDDDAIGITFVRATGQEMVLYRDGRVTRKYGEGFVVCDEGFRAARGALPTEFDGYEVEFPPAEVLQ
jgi:hypothetical protein